MSTPARRPFISVALPTYRRPTLISRAIESVLRQDFHDWELVVSDDGGPQGESWDIVSGYARRDPRVRLIANGRGRGQVENTNNAMLACGGDWIKVLHDDDWLADDALTKFAAVARAYPAVAFASCGVNVVRDNAVRLYVPPRRGSRVAIYPSQKCLVDLYLVRTTRMLGVVPSTLLVSRKAIEDGCLMRTYKSITSGVDQVFFLDLATRGDLALLQEGLVFYDATDHDSITNETSFAQVDQETLDLKHLTWRLIEDRRALPSPEVVISALRVARLRSRYRKQPWKASLRDAMGILRPSVMKIASDTAVARLRALINPWGDLPPPSSPGFDRAGRAVI